MSATMARQGGRVQLEQSDMRPALNLAKMAKGGFSRAAIEETQQLIKELGAEVREEKNPGVEFPGNHKVKAAIQNEVNCGCPGGCRRTVACYLPMKAASSRYIDVCDHSLIRSPKTQDQKLLTLR